MRSDHRSVLLWRVIFLCYSLAMTTGTHWPRLRLEIGDSPAPDKLIHMVAFGVLALMLWRTRWLHRSERAQSQVRSILLLWLIAAVWTALDEITQALPGLGRQVSWVDMFAGQIGVALAVGSIAVMQPLGGRINRQRITLIHTVTERLLLRFSVWLVISASAAVFASVGGLICAWLWTSPFAFEVEVIEGISLGMVIGGVFGGYISCVLLQQREFSRFSDADIYSLYQQTEREGNVRSCRPLIGLQQMGYLLWPPRQLLRRMLIRPIVIALLLGVLLMVVYIALLVLRLRFTPAADLFTGYSNLPADMRMAIDLGAYVGIGLVAVLLFRGRIARFYDNQGEMCAWCQHDIHASPVDAECIGRCGECGQLFVKGSAP